MAHVSPVADGPVCLLWDYEVSSRLSVEQEEAWTWWSGIGVVGGGDEARGPCFNTMARAFVFTLAGAGAARKL
jgi:hypothetical protein